MGQMGNVENSASEERLFKLIQDRLKPGADKEIIDQRIWDLFGEEWCVMFTDLSGFSRGVAEFGIIHFLQVIVESERLLVPVIEDHDGFLLKTEGDSLLVIFRRPHKALLAAIEMQRTLKDYNVGRADAEKILLCIGLGFGQVLRIGDSDVFGAEVNAASKLGEDTAEPWEILVTESVRDGVDTHGDFSFTPIEAKVPGGGAVYRTDYSLDAPKPQHHPKHKDASPGRMKRPRLLKSRKDE